MKKLIRSLAAVAMMAVATPMIAAPLPASDESEGEVTYDTFTFDFVTNDYGMTRATTPKNAADAVICNYDGIIITNGKATTLGLKKGGLFVPRYMNSGSFTVSTEMGDVHKIYVTQNNTAELSITYDNGVATVQNYADFDDTLIETMTVEFVSDGKKNPDLSFPAASAECIYNVDELKGLVLTNPYNLPVTYSSSNPDFVVSETGEISLANADVKSGSTTITATFAGNDEYRGTTKSYTFTLTPSLSSVEELYTLANSQKAYVNFPAVVTFGSGYYYYIQSLDGKSNALIYQYNAGYKAGQVIPAGWVATCTLTSGYRRFAMSVKPASTETYEDYIIPRVDAVTVEDACSVVILKKLTFTSEFPTSTYTAFNATAADGTVYSCINAFGLKDVVPGTYDVKCGVILSSNKPRLQIIECMEPTEDPKEPVLETMTIDFRVENPYGLTASKTFSNNAQILDADGIVLTAVEGVQYVKNVTTLANQGLKLNKFPTFGTIKISSEIGAITNVTYTCLTANPDIKVTITDGIAQITNNSDFDQYTITSITVEYESDGLKSPDLAYAKASVEVINGVDELKGQELTNPYNLPVSYTSSNADFVVNEEGVVSLANADVKSGSTTITATFEGNNEYRAKSVSYTLTLTAAAQSLKELIEDYSATNAKAYVAFPVVVTYGNGAFAYIQSLDGEYNTVIYQTSHGYTEGQVIPAGWTATASSSLGYLRYTMSSKPASTETHDFVVNSVEEITDAMVGSVVILKNVTFEDATKATLTSFTGKVGDTTYNFYNQFKVASVEAGTYDVKCGVIIASKAYRLQPIEYLEIGDELVIPALKDLQIAVSGEGTVEYDEEEEAMVVNTKVEDGEADAVVTLTVPAGFDNFIYMLQDTLINPEEEIAVASEIDPEAWAPVEALTQMGFTLGHEIKVPADGNLYVYGMYLVKGESAYAAAPYRVEVKAEGETVGVDSISVEENAEYYTLDGIKVANAPANGLYIKVVEGKVSKVLVK